MPVFEFKRDRVSHSLRRRRGRNRLTIYELLASPDSEISEIIGVPKDAITERAALQIGARGVRTAVARADHLADFSGCFNCLRYPWTGRRGDGDEAFEVRVGGYQVGCDLCRALRGAPGELRLEKLQVGISRLYALLHES